MLFLIILILALFEAEGTAAILDGDHKQFKTQGVFEYTGAIQDKDHLDASGNSEQGRVKQKEKGQNAFMQSREQGASTKAQSKDSYDKIAKDAFDYLNQVRQNPTLPIPKLEKLMKLFKGNILYKPGETPLYTNEGTNVIKELIAFLQKQQPLKALKFDKGLEKACIDHVKDTGPKGIIGHTGSDGSSLSDRIERYGEWNGNIGENINYGQKNGQDIIIELLIDDGVSTRGHRLNCFSPDFLLVGIAAGDHKKYQIQCVFDFASEFTPKNAKGQKPKAQQQSKPQNIGLGTNSGNTSAQPQQNLEKEQLPPGCVSLSTSTKESIKNGQKTTTITKTYKFKDGSTKTSVQTLTEG